MNIYQMFRGKEEGHQGTCIKDQWTKTSGGKDGMWEVGVGRAGGE